MSETIATVELEREPTVTERVIERYNKIASQYFPMLSTGAIESAFGRAGFMANQPQIQNARVKGIPTLPAEFSKEQVGDMLRTAYENEVGLRAVSQTLRHTAYPYFKITKTAQDIPTYHHYTRPVNITGKEAKEKAFKREAVLLDKLSKAIRPEMCAHKIAGQCATLGKVYYVPRYEVDKAHNKVEYAFLQQLPEDWCTIIGYNSVSGYTVSFNMMYFLQPGTDVKQFGDLFDPYLDDFNAIFEPPKTGTKVVYASRPSVMCKGKRLNLYPENIADGGAGNPRLFMQNGRWLYWVSLPVERVWTYEIDDTIAAVVPPLAGLMLTYGQQGDYEQAQLSLLLNPLIKIFTGSIPYFSDNGTVKEDAYKLSVGGRLLFESYFNQMMAANNTGGTAFYTAPVEDIKSHDYAASANANEISESFNRYGMEKAGLSSILPVAEDVKAAQVEASKQIESRFVTATVYPQFCRMMNQIYASLRLNYDWDFTMFGTIFTDDKIRENAQKALANGDTSAHFILAALDGQSWLDKLSMMHCISESGMLDMLIPPITSYTMKQDTNGGLPPQNGRPRKTIEEVGAGEAGESTEDAIDAYGTGD